MKRYIDKDVSVRSFYKLKHRGPDSSLYKFLSIMDYHMMIGFHRLGIIDPTPESMQPLIDDGVYIICNGEIYNYRDLIVEHDLKVKTKSDCEVILQLYKKYGADIAKYLNAEFAFVLYDSKHERIVVSRDSFGIRPLFYSLGDGIIAASEAKALSEYDNVTQFPPGETLVIDFADNFSTNWIKWHSLPDVCYVYSRYTICHEINTLLTSAVKARLMTERPLGCLLSGGLDSSLIVSIASRMIPDLQCFSVGLMGSVDIIAAKKVAAFLGIKNHHIVTFTVQEGLDVIEKVIYALESYDVTTIRASVPQYLLAKYISENTDIKVLLTGEGSDELFAGYRYNKAAPNASAIHHDGRRLLTELHMFDITRTDRTLAAHGLEARLPYLDLALVNFVMQTDPIHRLFGTMEKSILRQSFDETYLPHEILYRSKEAFSDAVSSGDVTWYKEIVRVAERTITDDEFESSIYSINQPMTKEALFYRKIFDKFYPRRDEFISHYWMPNWQNGDLKDPSATALACY